MVTITDVRVTGDLHDATIFYTVFGDDAAQADSAAALESAKGVLRTEVGRQTGVRFTPTLTFVLDSLPDDAQPHRRTARGRRAGRRRGRGGAPGRGARPARPTRTASRASSTTSRTTRRHRRPRERQATRPRPRPGPAPPRPRPGPRTATAARRGSHARTARRRRRRDRRRGRARRRAADRARPGPRATAARPRARRSRRRRASARRCRSARPRPRRQRVGGASRRRRSSPTRPQRRRCSPPRRTPSQTVDSYDYRAPRQGPGGRRRREHRRVPCALRRRRCASLRASARKTKTVQQAVVQKIAVTALSGDTGRRARLRPPRRHHRGRPGRDAARRSRPASRLQRVGAAWRISDMTDLGDQGTFAATPPGNAALLAAVDRRRARGRQPAVVRRDDLRRRLRPRARRAHRSAARAAGGSCAAGLEQSMNRSQTDYAGEVRSVGVESASGIVGAAARLRDRATRGPTTPAAAAPSPAPNAFEVGVEYVARDAGWSASTSPLPVRHDAERRETESGGQLTRRLLALSASAFVVLAAEPLYLLVDTAVVGHLGSVRARPGSASPRALMALLTVVGTFVEYGTTVARGPLVRRRPRRRRGERGRAGVLARRRHRARGRGARRAVRRPADRAARRRARRDAAGRRVLVPHRASSACPACCSCSPATAGCAACSAPASRS